MAKNKAGAKPLHSKPMRAVNLRLDPATVALAKQIGGGNVSAGVRRAVACYSVQSDRGQD